MSSPSQNHKPTEKQMDLLALIMQNMKAQPDVDWDTVAAKGGFKHAASARETYRQLKVKLGWTSNTVGPNTPTGKVRKRTAGAPAPRVKKAAFPKKAAKESPDKRSVDDDHEKEEPLEAGDC